MLTLPVSLYAQDTVWVEDALPAGATGYGDEPWNWVSSNPAPFSGTLAHQSNITAGFHQHYFQGATATLTLNVGDKLIAYVYLDPSNMPSEIMLQWNDGSWEHRAYWGADNIETSSSRYYVGPLPASGQWVRLEVPASQVGLEGRTLSGMAFKLYNGRATWDRAGKTPNAQSPGTNLALNKPATQSSTAWGGVAERAVDGDTSGNWANNSVTHTTVENQAWWQVDLGSVQSIQRIDLWNRTDCCGEALTNFYVFVSDVAFTSTSLTATQSQSGVSNYHTPGQGGSPTAITVNRTGRYVRVQLANVERLSLAEVQVWGTQGTPPTVSITSPVSGATFPAGSNITINADASDSDGTISKVEFFQGATKLGEDTAAPYSFTWSNVAVGSYALTAKATDNTGATTTSSAVNVTVNTQLSGRVTRADGTTAISGATVKLYQGTALRSTIITNGAGDYVFASPATGTYSVEASAAGYQTQRRGGMTVTETTAPTVNFSLNASSASAVAYNYDELGRLISAIDPAGQTATYRYDAVGNLLSIARNASTLVSIISFTPGSGPVNTSVTINGTGFSTTPSENTVRFNGVAATVTSSSATQIITSVPSGATTGTISVTTSAGTVTSSTPFTVGESSLGAPVITNFTPTVGASGASVNITGTNFETIPSNNRVRFSAATAGVSSATATNLAAAVPTGGSGHISVTTSAGRAVSAADFFVVPPPYGAAAVEYTGRMLIGETRTVAITQSNKIGMMIFNGTAGQLISMYLGTTTIPYAYVYIYKPDGAVLSGPVILGTSVSLTVRFIEPFVMPSSGTYTVLVDPGAGTGNMPIALYNVPPDTTGNITIGGPAMTVTNTTPGQNGKLFFNGTAGQIISLTTSNTTMGGSIKILKPDNSILGTEPAMGPGGYEAFIDQQSLPTTGSYTVVIDPGGASTGSTSVTLYNAPDITGTITPGGAAVNQTTNSPGQNIRLTFTGTAGQRVSLRSTSGTLRTYDLKLLKPDGTTQAIYSVASGYIGGYIDTQTLSANGTHTVLIDGFGAGTGSVTINLYNVPADVTGTVSIGGSAVPVVITTPGQNANLTFSGTAGQQVTVRITNNTMGVRIRLFDPDSTQLTTTESNEANFNLATQTLPVTGTYRIFVDPPETNTGSLNVNVTSP